MSTPLLRPSSLLLCLALVSCSVPETPSAANHAPPFNQLAVSGNACGPAALLNAFRYGDARWRELGAGLPGETDREQLSHVIRMYGLKPSGQLRGRTRWSRAGINVNDLTDLGNDLTATKFLPTLENEVLLPRSGETSAALLARVRGMLATSLGRGLPPVVSVRRQVLRNGGWFTVESHFITLLRVGSTNGTGLEIDYLDPWGGRRSSGSFRVSSESALGLEAVLPVTPVGKRLVRPGEKTLVTVSAAIGRW
ncbi:hypothetical protein [Luteolibacter sp. LG18]|uniref:hypothetical protein n=1 Tax=Luteolibacter sp. LG18 TaxID=2819286 RepID=UPI002B29DB77|nr:hypothetical protein llg_03560 [Luteolibacter sp. LG18]